LALQLLFWNRRRGACCRDGWRSRHQRFRISSGFSTTFFFVVLLMTLDEVALHFRVLFFSTISLSGTLL
jgi:hypothetical protein